MINFNFLRELLNNRTKGKTNNLNKTYVDKQTLYKYHGLMVKQKHWISQKQFVGEPILICILFFIAIYLLKILPPISLILYIQSVE